MIIISIKDLPKLEQDFYLNKDDEVEYAKQCEACANDCKQSYKVILHCKKRILVKTKVEYLDEINNQNKTVKEVANAIKINTRTLNSLLTNKSKDIDFETHCKLMKYLYKENIK